MATTIPPGEWVECLRVLFALEKSGRGLPQSKTSRHSRLGLGGRGRSFAPARWLARWLALPLLLRGSLLGQRIDPPATNPSRLSLPAFLAQKGYPTAPAAAVPEGYIGSSSCAECHRDEHASWHRTFHRTMTQPMTPETVLGNFDGTVIESGGFRYRVYRDGAEYAAEGPDPDLMMYWVLGKKQAPPATLPRVRLPVVMATGSHHYHQSLASYENGPGSLLEECSPGP